MINEELPPYEDLEESGIQCAEYLTRTGGWNQPPRLYAVFYQDNRLINSQLPIPRTKENSKFGRMMLNLSDKLIDMTPPFDDIARLMVQDGAIAFMAFNEIAINTTANPGFFAEQHHVKTSELANSFRCRLVIGTDLSGRKYRCIQREGEDTAYSIRGKYAEAGLLPIVINRLTLAIAMQTPWRKPDWITELQNLQVSSQEEFEAQVKADSESYKGAPFLMGRE